MAPTRQFEHEAQVSSSEEEDDDGSSSEEEVESDEDDKTSPPTPPKDKKPSAMKKPETSQTLAQQPQASSSSESESGSDSDSDSDSASRARKADPTVKPIASKPMMDEPPKSAKKPRSKPPSSSETPTKSRSKRPSEAAEKGRDAAKESKKAKTEAASEGDIASTAKKAGATTTESNDPKKQLFQRLWSEEDELNILKGMVEYMEKKGADPVADMNAFHEFVKDRVHIEVSKTQLSDKVRRLKKKYENNASKGKKGEDRTFSKAHEQRAYELSKKVWGPEANSVGLIDSPKVNGKTNKNQSKKTSSKAIASPKKEAEALASSDVKKMETEAVEHNVTAPSSAPLGYLPWSFGGSSWEEGMARDGGEFIKGEKRIELEEKWRKLKVEEIELFLKRWDLIREQAKLVLEALKSSGK